ncbi:MAG: hypothetical protein NBV67_02365 [Tagaea sp.]|nr:hypothetical protein [Tagaea sp.]
MPEKFWDAKTGQPNVEALAKSYTHVEQQFGKGREAFEAERLKARPEKPEGYALAIPEKHPAAEALAKAKIKIVDKAPEKAEPGVETYFVLDPKDPLFGFWREHAHKNGLSQDDFAAGVAQFVQAQAGRGKGLPSDEQMRGAAERLRATELGENAAKRFEHVVGQVKAIAGDSAVADLDLEFASPKAIASLEKLLARAGAPAFSPEAAPAAGAPSIDELRALIRSPEYQKGDPETVKKVAEGYRRHYPGEAKPNFGRAV